MPGRILRLSVKPRVPGESGLPKAAVPELRVTEAGAEGDHNNYRTRKLGGDPRQALLLLTEEVLRQLNDEGWPVRPGDLGENLTLADLTEAELLPGAILQVGEVVVEVTLACDPCTGLYTLPYVGPERGPEFLRIMVNRRGWYARVLIPGVLRPGMPVTLRQPSARLAD